MFPLGAVLLPGAVLPLHVFEPRYYALVDDCMAGDQEFGVVLIERGSEVGGGDVRTDVGTVARVVHVATLPGRRYAVVAVGTRRVRVTAWLADAPYPRAEVEDWPDELAGAGADEVAAALRPVVARLRRVLALKTELGEPAASTTTELSDEAVVATYQ